jgi:predicted PolB exonuclease-like 3'-5' exonuclease
MSKKRKHLSSSQAQFLGLKVKDRYRDGSKPQYSLDKKQLKKLKTYSELDAKGKVMTYDIETSLVRLDAWGTGKTYIRHDQLVPGPEGETRIISIAWKYIGEDKVHYLTWDDGCDREMIRTFMSVYNRCDMVIGQNNNSFDNKIVKARAAKHRLFINRFVKSFDIYRKVKTVFKLPSYSMAYMAKYFGLTLKQSHEGIKMWKMIQYGNPEEKAEYLQKMVDYNIGDIVTTEELYMLLRPYMSTVTHLGVANGDPRWTCPVSGSQNIELYNTIITEAGTVQRILFCPDSQHQFKVSNAIYREFLESGSVELPPTK